MPRRKKAEPWWADLAYEDLLDTRLCDLELDVRGTALQARIDRLHAELARAGLRFRPHVWLSTDWFTPDDVPGFAVPFFLAHSRLARIEHRQMFEVEGGTFDECMKLLRHETGHAIDNAYRLHHKKRWRETFGRFSEPYDQAYRPNPRSRRFVQHLDFWYAQSHPAEDWAETFAVWLRPGSRWRREYAGWPALRKLQFVDDLMQEVRDATPRVRSRRTPDSLARLRLTLREYYERRKAFYSAGQPAEFDDHLLRLFSSAAASTHRPSAAGFLRRNRRMLRRRVSAVTGQYRYEVDQALREMINRCRELNLRLRRSERETRVSAAVLLTLLTTTFVQGRRQEFRR